MLFAAAQCARYWHIADIPGCTAHVCYWTKADIGRRWSCGFPATTPLYIVYGLPEFTSGITGQNWGMHEISHCGSIVQEESLETGLRSVSGIGCIAITVR